jgi:hypothetical protein
VTKDLEEVLGMLVVFVCEDDGRWRWEVKELDVRHDPAVRFATKHGARMAFAAMVFAFFVMEEETSSTEPFSTKP